MNYRDIMMQCAELEDNIAVIDRELNPLIETKNRLSEEYKNLQENFDLKNDSLKSKENALEKVDQQKNELIQKLREFNAINEELRKDLNQLIESDNKFKLLIEERNQEIEAREAELKRLTVRKVKLDEKKSSREKTSPDQKEAQPERSSKSIIREMQIEIVQLERKAKIAETYQLQLQSRIQQIAFFEKTSTDLEKKIQELRSEDDNYARTATRLRDEKDSTIKSTEMEINCLTEQIDKLRERNRKMKKVIAGMVEKQNQVEKEIMEMHDVVVDYESKYLGLPEALKEEEELRAKVRLRDQKIAELVKQMNATENLMNALTLKLNSTYDISKFHKENETRKREKYEKKVADDTRRLISMIKTLCVSQPVRATRVNTTLK